MHTLKNKTCSEQVWFQIGTSVHPTGNVYVTCFSNLYKRNNFCKNKALQSSQKNSVLISQNK